MKGSLLKYADRIPELGHGGKTIKDYLIQSAKRVREGEFIIDIAPFLGSTTMYLAEGIRQSGKDVKIYAYDRWIADDKMDIKLNRKLKGSYPEGYDFKHLYWEYVKEAWEYIIPTQIHVLDIAWKLGKIGLYVDDIGVGKKRVDYLMKIFSPYFVPDHTVLYILDYYQHITREHMPHMKYQKDFFEANHKVFKFIERCKGSVTAKLLYLGGKINYNVKGKSCGQDTA